MNTPIVTPDRDAVALHSSQADLFAARYAAADMANDFRSCFAYSRRRLKTFFDRYLPTDGCGARILDVGCGTGHHLADLRRRGYEGAGVDGSAEMLDHARTLNPDADIRQSDVQVLPFPDASFDIVLSIEVLRYLADPAACLREIGRVLRPGGLCLATAAPRFNLNGYWLVNRLAPYLPFARLVRYQQHFTSSGRLRAQFQAAGFARTDVHGVYLGPINWVERIAPRLLPSVLRKWEPCDAAIADLAILRDLSNMYLVHAAR